MVPKHQPDKNVYHIFGEMDIQVLATFSSLQIWCIYQWNFQEPKLEVPTIYKAYFSGLCKGISPQNIALYGTNVPPF